jgi:hypothetical protein
MPFIPTLDASCSAGKPHSNDYYTPGIMLRYVRWSIRKSGGPIVVKHSAIGYADNIRT